MKLIAAAALAAALAVSACSDPEPQVADPSASAGVNSGAVGTAGLPAPGTVEYFNQVIGDRVFFDTDQHALDSAARATLDAQANWLQTNAGTNVTIEGHADERGTRQYNLALGARRANSVRDYLVARGVSPARLNTVTFGKERPVALCSDESCWSQNRRAVSIVVGAPTS